MKKLIIAAIYILPLFARADVYIDHVTEHGRQYIIIETNNIKAKVAVDPKASEDEQVKQVCKVVHCNGKI